MRVKNRNRLRFRHLRAFIIVGLLLVIAAALVVGSRAGFVSLPFLSKIPEYTIVPVQRMFNTVALWVDNRLADKRELEAQVVRLTNELQTLRLQADETSQLKEEIEQLRALLGFKQSGDHEYIASSVIAMAPGNWFSLFTLDSGLNDGVALNDTVIVPEGVIGRVIEVTDTYCVVRAIIDSASAVAGIVERTRDHVIVTGVLSVSASGGLLEIAYSSPDSELRIGDRIHTSGMDGLFPKDILIGHIKAITTMADGSQIITITPSADFRHMEEVLIIKGDSDAP